MAVVSNWTGTDPTAAGKWLQRFPAGAERDTAIGGFAYQLANRDPVLAFEWIGTVGDPIVRDAQYRSIVEWRMKADSDAARNWIESSDRIPDQLKAEVLKAQ